MNRLGDTVVVVVVVVVVAVLVVVLETAGTGDAGIGGKPAAFDKDP